MGNLKNICLAVSLPVIAFLTFYFYRQKKITNICKKDDDQIIKNDDNQINKLENNQIKNSKSDDNQLDSKDLSINESIVKKSINQTNQLINETDQLINETDQSIEEIINLNNNNNDFKCKLDQDRDISFIIEKNSVKENEKSFIKEDEQIKDQSINQLPNDSRKVSKLINKFNESINETNRSINQSKEKLNESSNQLEDELNRSINSVNQSKDESIGLVKSIISKLNESSEELNDSSQNKSTNQSKIINQKSSSLEEGEEIFETNNYKSIDTLDKTLNDDQISKSNSINDSNQHMTQNSTNLTFDTACDSSLNRTLDTTSNATINTLLDQNAFNSFNSNQTLLSNDDTKDKIENLNEQNLNDSLNVNNIEINVNNGEVKEDLNLIEETATNKTIIENILDNSQVLNSTTLNNSTSLAKDDVNSEKQIIYEQINDIASKNDDEKFLNVTEDEFKNDSKLEIANHILNDLKARIEEEQNNLVNGDNSVNEDNSVKEDNSIKQDNSVNENLNKSEDDSICCVFDSNELKNCKSDSIEEELKPKEAKTNGTNDDTINLNESNDSDVVFVCTKPIAKQTNGHSNNKTIQNDKKIMNQKSIENEKISDYCFEIAQALTGLLVGTKGSFINSTMQKSNAKIQILRHPMLAELNLCLIQGTNKNIADALSIIRSRFPIRKFPQLTLNQIDPNIISIEAIPQTSQLCLPEGVTIEVGISVTLSPNHIFLHQITHPTFNLLPNLENLMTSTYKFNDAPGVDQLAIGVIAAVENDGHWFRAIVEGIDKENCMVKLLDHGGKLTVNKNSLRQVRRDFMTLQFQACEAILSNIEPIDGIWSTKSVDFFKRIAEKKILQSLIVGYTENRIPIIHLIRFEDNKAILINRELVDNNFANWID